MQNLAPDIRDALTIDMVAVTSTTGRKTQNMNIGYSVGNNCLDELAVD